MQNRDMSRAKAKNIENKLERVRQYNTNPKLCKQCQNPISYKQLLNGNVFCKHSCSATYSNAHRIINNRSNKRKPRFCLICGNETPSSKNVFCEPNGKCDSIYTRNRALKLGLFQNKSTIRRYLLLTRNHICARCKSTEWLGGEIPLETHHKDGNYKNNEEQNLELLCPNCHSITDNYRGKNRGNGRGDYKHARLWSM